MKIDPNFLISDNESKQNKLNKGLLNSANKIKTQQNFKKVINKKLSIYRSISNRIRQLSRVNTGLNGNV
jgi:hypothetical protein